jgi:hypothetical protein
MLAPVTHIIPLTVVQRRRLLPIEGRLKVRQGQNVRPTDVIASAAAKPKHLMLDVAAGLGVGRDEAEKHIERYLEDDVIEGDIIARKSGLVNRFVRAPVGGKIVLITGGYVMIEAESEQLELLAGIPGQVTELIHNLGAVIETSGALIQGLWGNGRVDFGLLNVLAEKPDAVLTPDQIDVSMRGAVLLSGHCHAAEVFRAASEQRIRGLVLGSMDADLVPLARKMAFPVLLTDGFGRQPMGAQAFKLLTTNNKRDVALNAEPMDHAAGTRPEILIPLPGADGMEAPGAIGRFAAGTRVRITRQPYRGQLAVINNLLPGRTNLPNGLRVSAASVTIEAGETIQIPVANLEILG